MAPPLKTPHDAPLLVDPTKWVRRALYYARRWGNFAPSDDRNYDEAMNGLIRACQTYEDTGKRSFRNWLLMHVDSQMKEKYRRMEVETKYLNSHAKTVHRLRVEAQRDGRQEAIEELNHLSKNIAPNFIDVLRLRTNGMDRTQIALATGVSNQSINYREKSAVSHIQKGRGMKLDHRMIHPEIKPLSRLRVAN